LLGDSSQTQDMELCSGDSTPTSEKSFQLSNVPAQRHSSSTPQTQVFLFFSNSKVFILTELIKI